MSEGKEKDIIAVTKNQALGMGGAGVAITTIVALTSTFLTSNDGKLLQKQIDQNKTAIHFLQTEIKEGFKEQSRSLKEAVKELEKVMREASSSAWRKTDHDRFEHTLNERLDRMSRRIETIEQRTKKEK